MEAKTEVRHSSLSRAMSAVMPFEVRDRIEEEHTPETDLRPHHNLEEGDWCRAWP